MKTSIRLREIARTEGVLLLGHETVGEAQALLDRSSAPGLVVLDHGSVRGVLCRMDLLGLPPDRPVSECLPIPVTLFDDAMDAGAAWQVMLKEKVGVHPYLGADGAAGLVSFEDLVRVLELADPAPKPFEGERRFSIMIVDDSPVVRKSLQATLEEAGYRTVVAEDGVEAIQRVRTFPDLILLDVQMPNLDGYEVLTALRKGPFTREIPVIMLTAMAELESRIEAFSHGADDYLLKPYLKRELLARIQRLLEARALRDEIVEIRRAKDEYLARLGELTEFNFSIIRQMGDGLLVTDLEGRVIKANPALANMLRLDQGVNIIGRRIDEISPDLKEACEPTSAPREVKVRLAHGKSAPLEHSTSVLTGGQGNPIGRICIFRDLTEEHKSMEALRRDQKEILGLKTFLESVLNHMNSGLIVTNLEGRIAIINRMGASILGVESQSWEGRYIEEISPDLSIFREIILPQDRAQEAGAMLPDGSELPLGFTSNYLLDADGSQAGVITAFKDLTEIREMRKELRTKEKLATIGEMAGGIAHEIKNPIFAISSAIQILQYESEISEDQRNTLDIMYKETMRVDRLIKQLLTFTARRGLKLTPHRPADLIEEVISLHRGLLKGREIEVQVDSPAGLPEVDLDRDLMIQVFLNLIQNAIEATEDGGRIDVDCRVDETGRDLIVKVMDRGPGIPDEHQDRVFEIFFSTKKGSSGLGLAISRKILLEHGGAIRPEHREGGGTAMVVELPVRRDHVKNHPDR